MQKTDFPFEILVHDDASTDGTAEIIRTYAKRFPQIVLPLFQTENQYSKKVSIGSSFQYPRARGKYIALCEGDDYWLSPDKLQQQFDFMEAHPLCAWCFSGAAAVDRAGNRLSFSGRRIFPVTSLPRTLLPAAADSVPPIPSSPAQNSFAVCPPMCRHILWTIWCRYTCPPVGIPMEYPESCPPTAGIRKAPGRNVCTGHRKRMFAMSKS